MLDNLENTIISCKAYTGDYQKDKIEYEKLKEALKPVMEIRDKALELPDIPLKSLDNGVTIKRVELNMIAESTR